MTISINKINQVGRNLWKYDNKYYRMAAKGVTPNGCWLVSPQMIQLVDIDAATGKDVYGDDRLNFNGVVGTVPAGYEFLKS